MTLARFRNLGFGDSVPGIFFNIQSRTRKLTHLVFQSEPLFLGHASALIARETMYRKRLALPQNVP